MSEIFLNIDIPFNICFQIASRCYFLLMISKAPRWMMYIHLDLDDYYFFIQA